MKRVILLATVLALALPLATMAQGKPDFSGTWTLDSAKSDPPPQRQGGGGGGGGGVGTGGGGGGMATPAPIVIKQTATELTIERQAGGNTVSSVYKLDGTESTIPGGRGGEAKAKAHFEGSTLVIETTREGQNGPTTTKEVRSIDASGKVMTVETTQGSNPSRKTVYNKTM